MTGISALPPQGLSDLSQRIKTLRREAEALGKMGSTIPAVARNVERILASVRMLELHINDLLDEPTESR